MPLLCIRVQGIYKTGLLRANLARETMRETVDSVLKRNDSLNAVPRNHPMLRCTRRRTDNVLDGFRLPAGDCGRRFPHTHRTHVGQSAHGCLESCDNESPLPPPPPACLHVQAELFVTESGECACSKASPESTMSHSLSLPLTCRPSGP